MTKVRQVGFIFILLFLFTSLTTTLLTAAQASTSNSFGQWQQTPEVELSLLDNQAQIESNGYLIYFREKADLSKAYQLDWETRGEFVVDALQSTAVRSQADVKNYLDAQGVKYESFWIENVIVVASSNRSALNGLLAFPEIEAIRSRKSMFVPEPPREATISLRTIQAIEPNISHLQTPDVWALGFRGDGTVVASIDTGVRSTHEALVRQYRGTSSGSHDYNWLGALSGLSAPLDTHGHGTHTMGTMVGEDETLINQIGVAPNAQWIACEACNFFGCPDSALLACAQWVTAPYPIGNPDAPDPNKRPHVVNNSWGDCQQTYDNWFQDAVDAWLAAGIYPVFSNGNATNCGYTSPPGLNTVGNPARYGNVTGVGSSGQSNGQYAPHSNWGPTDNVDTINPMGPADMKPQVVAPGVNIRSSTPGSDSEYQQFGWTGTSMSAPHLSGLVALMWGAAPCLIGDYATTETIIESTAVPIPYDDGTGGGAHWPNYATGWGEINALEAVNAALQACTFQLQAEPRDLDICLPDNAVYTVRVKLNKPGFVDLIDLTIQGAPAGTTTSFIPNQQSAPFTSTLTLSNTIAALPGAYEINIIGTALTSTQTTTVHLNLFSASPGIPTLTAPVNKALDVDLLPTFAWEAGQEASHYFLEVALDENFNTPVYSRTIATTTHKMETLLAKSTTYHWRVTAVNSCGSTIPPQSSTFTTRDVPSVLLVDDDDNLPDVQAYYSSTLTNLGVSFDIFDAGNEGRDPDRNELEPYETIIWFTGVNFQTSTGPSGAGIDALSDYLEANAGSCLFLSSQDYLFAQGGFGFDNLTPFMENYLGAASGISDVGQTAVTGMNHFTGSGPYTLSYPFENYSDRLEPDFSAQLGFTGDMGEAALTKTTAVWRTTWWGFPFEAIPTDLEREQAMTAVLNWCHNAALQKHYLPIILEP